MLQEGGFVDFRAAAVARPDEPEEVDARRARLAPRDVERGGEIDRFVDAERFFLALK